MTRKLWHHNGSFYLRVRSRVDGKEVTKYRNLGRDRYAAIDRARALEDVPDLSTHPDVRAFSRRWLGEYVAGRRTPQNRALAKQRMADHVLPALGGKLMAEVRSPDLRLLRLALDAGRLSPQSVAHVLADVRCLLRYAVESEVIPRSPWIRGLMPRLQEPAPRPLTDDEVRKLVTMAEPWGFYLRFLIGTGVRWGEARRAEASHVERGQLVVSQTKSGRVRRVPIPPDLLREIRGRVGRLVHVVNAQNVKVQAERVVPGFHVHRCRHTFACRWLDSGGSIEALREVLGHSSVKVTGRYGRPGEPAVRRDARLGWALVDTIVDTTAPAPEKTG